MTRLFAVLVAGLLPISAVAHAQFITADPSMLSTTGANLAPMGAALQPVQPEARGVAAPPNGIHPDEMNGREQQQFTMYQQQETQQFQALLRQQAMHPGPLANGTQSLNGLRQQQDQFVKPSPAQLQARAQLDALFRQGIRTQQQRQQAEQLFAQGQWRPLTAEQRQAQLQAAQQQLAAVQQQLKAKQDQILRTEQARDQQMAQLKQQRQQALAALTRQIEQTKSGQGPADGANTAAAQLTDLAAMYDRKEQETQLQYARILQGLKGESGALQQQQVALQQQIEALRAS